MDNKKNKESSDRKFYLFTFRIVGDFGATIALPVIVFVLIGQWLDRIYSRGPLFTILAFILAALITGKMIYKKAKNYGQEYQKLVDRNEISQKSKIKMQNDKSMPHRQVAEEVTKLKKK